MIAKAGQALALIGIIAALVGVPASGQPGLILAATLGIFALAARRALNER